MSEDAFVFAIGTFACYLISMLLIIIIQKRIILRAAEPDYRFFKSEFIHISSHFQR